MPQPVLFKVASVNIEAARPIRDRSMMVRGTIYMEGLDMVRKRRELCRVSCAT